APRLLLAEDVEQPEGAEQADDAEEVVGVEVGEEDVAEGEAHAVAHHLALGALAAVEQQGLPLAGEREGGDVAVDGGAGGAGAEEGELQHGAESKVMPGERGTGERGNGRPGRRGFRALRFRCSGPVLNRATAHRRALHPHRPVRLQYRSLVPPFSRRPSRYATVAAPPAPARPRCRRVRAPGGWGCRGRRGGRRRRRDSTRGSFP